MAVIKWLFDVRFFFSRRGFIKRDGFGASEGTPAPTLREQKERKRRRLSRSYSILRAILGSNTI